MQLLRMLTGPDFCFLTHMSVYKRYKGKRISSSHPRYADARWWIYKRLKGKTIHQSVPEAKTKQEAELAERQIIKASFDHSYSVADTTTTLASFIEKKYRPYVEQNNVNKGAKDLYIRLLLEHFKKQTIVSISPQDCRDCRAKLKNRQNKRKKESELSPASINRIMSTLSKIRCGPRCLESKMKRSPRWSRMSIEVKLSLRARPSTLQRRIFWLGRKWARSELSTLLCSKKKIAATRSRGACGSDSGTRRA